MAKAYWIATYRSVKDPAALEAYAKLAGPAIKTLEDGLNQRTVVIEFDSVAAAMAAYESPAYQKALKVLGDGAVRDIRIVEEMEQPKG
jgi:uncharacterized protein (DUF1330 family)